jgi:hypothetical protein
MAVGRSVRTSHWTLRGRGLHLAGGWGTALSSGGKPVLRAKCGKKMLLPNGPSISRIRPIVSAVLCGSSAWREAAKGDRARRVSAVRHLLPPPATVERKPIVLGPIRWVDVAGRALRRTWTAHWRRQYVEILPLVQAQQEAKPPPRPPRALRSHHRWSWQDRLARNAWWGPPHLRVSVAGVPSFLAIN